MTKDLEISIDRITQLIENNISEPRKTKINKMLEEIGEFYFTAPASSKKEYHSAYDGGLAIHSLNVFDNLRKLNEAFSCNFSMEEMVLCSLFHDVGKAVDSTCLGPNYIPTNEKWKNDKGIFYEKSQKGVYYPNYQKTMFVLQKFGIELSDVEYQTILLNDGMYLEANKTYMNDQCSLSVYLHMADLLATRQEKEKD